MSRTQKPVEVIVRITRREVEQAQARGAQPANQARLLAKTRGIAINASGNPCVPYAYGERRGIVEIRQIRWASGKPLSAEDIEAFSRELERWRHGAAPFRVLDEVPF